METNKESFEGTILINAAGAWVDEVAKMANVQPLDFIPMRRSIARVPSPTKMPVLVTGQWYMELEIDGMRSQMQALG